MKIGRTVLLISLVIQCVVGCANPAQVVNNDYVIKVGRQEVTEEEAQVLLCALQKKYEDMFGKDQWEMSFGDTNLKSYMMEQLKTQLIQLASMKLLADENEITLSKEEKEQIKTLSGQYMDKLENIEKDFTKEDVISLYTQYVLGQKVYERIVKNVVDEISDDEARMIDVQVIFLRTFHLSSDGEKKEMTTEEKQEVLKNAERIHTKASGDSTFEALAAAYNESDKIEYHIGRGEMSQAFEEAAFNLTNGQISPVVEDKDGYYIIKCISNYNQEETDAHKESLYQAECKKVFNQAYDSFMEKINVKVNKKNWNSIKLLPQCGEVSFPESIK